MRTKIATASLTLLALGLTACPSSDGGNAKVEAFLRLFCC